MGIGRVGRAEQRASGRVKKERGEGLDLEVRIEEE